MKAVGLEVVKMVGAEGVDGERGGFGYERWMLVVGGWLLLVCLWFTVYLMHIMVVFMMLRIHFVGDYDFR